MVKVDKTIQIRLLLKASVVVFFPVVGLFTDVWTMKIHHKRGLVVVYQVSACVEAAAASFGKNVIRHCGNVSARRPGLSCTYAQTRGRVRGKNKIRIRHQERRAVRERLRSPAAIVHRVINSNVALMSVTAEVLVLQEVNARDCLEKPSLAKGF